MTYTHTNFELSTQLAETVKHIIANLPVFKAEDTPEPTMNEHFVLYTVDEVRQWYTENFSKVFTKHRSIVLVAVKDGFRVELIPYQPRRSRQ